MSCQTILLIVGAVLEFSGIVLIAFPDFLPYLRRFARSLGHRARLVVNGLRRLLRLPPRRKVVEVSGGVTATASMGAKVLKGLRKDSIIEEKVAFLLQRDEEAQEAMNALTRRVKDIEEATPRELDRLRAELRSHTAGTVTSALEEYRNQRIVGTLALAAGLICTTWANFV